MEERKDKLKAICTLNFFKYQHYLDVEGSFINSVTQQQLLRPQIIPEKQIF